MQRKACDGGRQKQGASRADADAFLRVLSPFEASAFYLASL